jgi:hypothetical protein
MTRPSKGFSANFGPSFILARNALFEPIPPLEMASAVTAPSSTVGSPRVGDQLLDARPAETGDLLFDLNLSDKTSRSGSPVHSGLSTDPLNMIAHATPEISLKCVGSYLVYSRYGLDITFKRFEDPSAADISTIRAIFLNDQSEYAIRDLSMQVAVPRSFSLFLNPSSTTVLAPHQEAIQIMTVQRHKHTNHPIKTRVKMTFGVEDELVEDQFDFVFPDYE